MKNNFIRRKLWHRHNDKINIKIYKNVNSDTKYKIFHKLININWWKVAPKLKVFL
jgi:hypothetical protein